MSRFKALLITEFSLLRVTCQYHLNYPSCNFTMIGVIPNHHWMILMMMIQGSEIDAFEVAQAAQVVACESDSIIQMIGNGQTTMVDQGSGGSIKLWQGTWLYCSASCINYTRLGGGNEWAYYDDPDHKVVISHTCKVWWKMWCLVSGRWYLYSRKDLLNWNTSPLVPTAITVHKYPTPKQVAIKVGEIACHFYQEGLEGNSGEC